MADKKEKKGINLGVYAVASGIIVAVVLVVLTIFAFTSRYTAFSPEKTAQYYTDVIVQNADGYNAYKNTLVSKNQKFGNFVVDAYMAPYVNKDAQQNEQIGTGSDEEAAMLNEVYSQMYDYYVELITNNGMDNYDVVFSQYFAKLAEVRKAVIGDEFMSTDFMFSVFESNVDTYSKSMTGTDTTYEADGKTVKEEATVGKYQEMFGKDYKFTTSVVDTKELDEAHVKAYVESYKERITPVAASGEAKADSFGIVDADKKHQPKSAMVSAFEKLDCSEIIDAVDECTVSVALEDGTEVANVTIYVVKIGNSWYVDNTNVNTSALYLA